MYKITIIYYEDHTEWFAEANGCHIHHWSPKGEVFQVEPIMTELEMGVALRNNKGDRVAWSVKTRNP